MEGLILGGVLAWLVAFVWWGMDLAFRAGRRDRVVGAILIALAVLPSLIALSLGT